MKFKTEGELIKENTIDNMDAASRNSGVIHGITITLLEITKRIAFYKKYKENPNALFRSEPAKIIYKFNKLEQERYTNIRKDDFDEIKEMRKY